MKHLKLAIITDIHHGPNRHTKKGSEALRLLTHFVEKASQRNFDLIVDLGDRISNVDKMKDQELAKEVAAVFQSIEVPLVHLLGNHDLHFLSLRENEAILQSSLESHSRDLKGYHLVFWNLDLSSTYADNEIPSKKELLWLQEDLKKTLLPTIIFTHVPLDEASMIGNFWFQNNLNSASLNNTVQARNIIETSGKVIACISGHTHWNKCSTIDGVLYLTIQSLTESFTTDEKASEAWAELTVAETLRCVVHGNDAMFYEVATKSVDAHWARPRPAVKKLEKTRLIAHVTKPIKGLLIDMDGVIFNGEKAIAGSAKAIQLAKDRGLKIIFLTNNARLSSFGYVKKLARHGMAANPEDIITSGEVVGKFLKELDSCPKVHIIGSNALRNVILSTGTIESNSPDFVIAGADLNLRINDFTVAVRHLINGARLLATNTDPIIPTQNGPEPEAGPVVSFLEAASGQIAKDFGKPQRMIFDMAIERLGFSRDTVVMIGDTVATDIVGAKNAGLRSVLVETGNPYSVSEGEMIPKMRAKNLEKAIQLLFENVRS